MISVDFEFFVILEMALNQLHERCSYQEKKRNNDSQVSMKTMETTKVNFEDFNQKPFDIL